MFAAVMLAAVLGQCPGGVCPPMAQIPMFGPQIIEQGTIVYRGPVKARMRDATGQEWEHDDAAYLARWIAERNAQAARPSTPAAPPAPDTAADDRPAPAQNFGLDLERIPKVPKAWYGGNVEPPSGPRVIGGPANRVHVTAIAPTQEAADAVVAGWRANPRFAALEAEYGDRIAVKAYAADNPIVADVGLPNGGNPDVVVQDSAGKVRLRAAADPGAERIVSEVRERDPLYSPSNDPTPDGPSELTRNPALLVVLGVLVFLIVRKGKWT